jgi:hypothetical protein
MWVRELTRMTDNYSIKEVLAFPFMKDDTSARASEKPSADGTGIPSTGVEKGV